MGVFVVDVGAGHGGVVILQLHLPPQLRLLPPQLRRQRLPLCEPITVLMSEMGVIRIDKK